MKILYFTNLALVLFTISYREIPDFMKFWTFAVIPKRSLNLGFAVFYRNKHKKQWPQAFIKLMNLKVLSQLYFYTFKIQVKFLSQPTSFEHTRFEIL